MATTLCKRKTSNKQLVKRVERFNGTKVKVNPIYLTYNNHYTQIVRAVKKLYTPILFQSTAKNYEKHTDRCTE